MGRKRVVVVGAGRAGLRAAESLRANDYSGEILIVGAEPHRPYDRPPVSKQALASDLRLADALLPVRRSLADAEWLLGTRVEHVDLAAGVVELADGSSREYDGLVLATGVRPRRLGAPGPAAGRFPLRTWEDALGLRPHLVPGARVLVVGAGFIGCEVAAVARARGCAVTCVAVDTEPMVHPLGELLGAELRRRHEARGVRFRMSTGVASLLGEDRVVGAVLDDGTRLPCEVVVEAVGSDARVDLTIAPGLDTADGLLADNGLRLLGPGGAALPTVVAAGDVVRYPNPRFDGVPRRVEHWDNAAQTGRRAGACLAAALGGRPREAEWRSLPSFWSDQGDVALQSFGLPGLADPDGVRVLEGHLDGEVVVGYHRGDELVGVVGLGMLDRVLARREAIGRP